MTDNDHAGEARQSEEPAQPDSQAQPHNQGQSTAESQRTDVSGVSPSEVDEQVRAASRIGKLFDVRLVIGGLLSVYGVILTIKGATDSASAVRHAAGIRINLWTGLAMLVVGALFLLWVKLAPLHPPTEQELRDALAAGAAPSVDD